MEYKLAKALKDAGFPQKDFPVEFHCVCGTTENLHPADGRCCAYLVPLSELIEACGTDFAQLARHEGNIGNNQFVAHALPIPAGYAGSSPEEAMARLWLALN